MHYIMQKSEIKNLVLTVATSIYIHYHCILQCLMSTLFVIIAINKFASEPAPTKSIRNQLVLLFEVSYVKIGVTLLLFFPLIITCSLLQLA